MRAALDDLSVVNDQDHIRTADGGQAVRNDEGRASGHHLFDGVLDQPLCDRIDRAGRFVKDENTRVGQQRARKRQQLLFAGGEAVAALADVGIIAVRQTRNNRIRRNRLDRRLDLLHCRVLPAVAQVFQNGAREQMRRLKDIADVGVQPELAAFAGVPPVNQHLTLRRLKEAADQIHQRRFARAGLADDGDVGALRHLEVEMLQNVFFSVRIAEGHVAELDIAVQRLPVLLLRMERVAVLRRDLRRIAHVGLCLHELCEALNVHLHVHKGRKHLHQPLDRLHHALCVVHEHRKRTDQHHALTGDDAAAPEHDCQRGGGRKRGRGHEHAAEMHGPDADALHLAGQLVELLFDLVLDHERFGRFCARNALVEGRRDLRVVLAHLSVVEHKLFLEEDAGNDQDRDDHHDAQRQLPVQREHHDNGKQQIGDLPHALHNAPRQRTRNAVGIGDHARVDIADAVLIEIGEGQRLHMVKRLTAQVAADIKLRLTRAVGRDVVGGRLHSHDQQIQRHKGPDALHGAVRDEVVDGVLLEQRDHHVHSAGKQAEQHHAEEQPSVASQIRDQLRDAEPRESLMIFLLHAVSPSPIDICMS